MLALARAFLAAAPGLAARHDGLAVVSPYRGQVGLIRALFAAELGDELAARIDVNTIDGFQGREREVVLFSVVRSPAERKPKRGKGGAFAALQALQPHAAPATALAAAAEALRSGVRPGLEALRDDYRARWRDAGAARLRLDAELDASEAALAQRRDDRAALEAEAARADAAIADAKERVRDAVTAAEAQAAALEVEAEAVRAGSEARVHGSEAELSALRASYDELAAACASEAAHTQQALLAALDSLMIHKQAVQDALGRCAAVLATLGDDLGAVVTYCQQP